MHDILKDRKVVFFDLGNTLFRAASGDWTFTNRFLDEAGEKLKTFSEAQIRDAVRPGSEYLKKNHYCLSVDEEAEHSKRFYAILSDGLGLGLTEGQISDIVADRMFNISNYILYPDTVAVLTELAKTFRLGIISDTSAHIVNVLTGLGIIHFFSFITFSYELGVYKPDERMYRDALGKCGCRPGETVFIDDLPKNLRGAELMGIAPILISANGGPDPETPYTTIHSLSELL